MTAHQHEHAAPMSHGGHRGREPLSMRARGSGAARSGTWPRLCALLFGCLFLLQHGASRAQEFSLDDDVWELLVLPVDASALPLETVFGNVLDPIDYEQTWIVFLFDQLEQRYVKLSLTDAIPVGSAFWIKQITGQGVTLDLPAGLEEPAGMPSIACAVVQGCFQQVLSNQSVGNGEFGYNMIGSPFERDTTLSELVLVGGEPNSQCFDGCAFDEAVSVGIIADRVFTYDPAIADYTVLSAADTLSPWQGFWAGAQVDGPVENPALLFPATPEVVNPCEGVTGETAACPLPTIAVESSPFDIQVAVGTPVNVATTVELATLRSELYLVSVTQQIEAIGGSVQDLTVQPNVVGVFQSETDRTTVDNQVVTAMAPGRYRLITTATVQQTGATATSTVQIVASESPAQVLAGAPGFTPATVLPGVPTNVAVSVLASSQDSSLPLTVSLQGDVSVTLLDDGNGADLAAGDGAFSGVLEISAGQIGAGECLDLTGLVMQGNEVAGSVAVPLCASTVPAQVAPPDFGNTATDAQNDSEILLTELLVSVDSGTTDAQLQALAQLVGGELVGGIPQINVYQIGFTAADLSVADLQARIDLLESRPFVEYAEPSAVARTQFVVPSDTRFSAQGSLTQVRADEAWAIARGGATIAVIDTGVDTDHPDLAANLLSGTDLNNGDDVPEDDNGHGTHVSGIAAAVSDNGAGVSGVAWDSKILPVKGCNAGGSCATSAMAAGIVYAADHGARIINVSVRQFDGFSGVNGTVERTYCKAVAYASQAGSLVVAAAGNDGVTRQAFPAACPGAVAVGNVTAADARYVAGAGSSNYGPWVDIAAPGVQILSTVPIGGNCSLCNATGYATTTGTSMSSPLVAGAAAVLLSRQSLSNDRLLERLQRTAVELPSDAQLGAGRIDLFEAVFNGSFEEGNLALWTTAGTASSKTGLGAIVPQHRKRMGSVSTGPAAAQVSGSLEQAFTVQPGVTSFPFSFRYAFISEEYPEFVGTPFNDSLRVVLITPEGTERLLAEESINEASFINIDGIDFPGGDNTVGWTGWQSVSINITVTQGPGVYRVSLQDAGDTIYDTETLIDDIKFESSAAQE